MTVRGPIAPESLGFCLPHEHIVLRFGEEPQEPPQFDDEAVFGLLLPYLQYISSLGVKAIADCTASYFGRHPALLRRLSEAGNLHLLTNTGFYGAAQDRYVPEMAFNASPQEIAAIWVGEFKNGIGETGVRPGFVKTAIDPGPLSAIDHKLIEAAALTHLQTGLSLAVHTAGNVEGAFAQLAVLEQYKVRPDAWIWVHAQESEDVQPLLEAAARGAWISLDGVCAGYYDPEKRKLTHSNSILRHMAHLRALRDAGFLNQVLLSHDGWIMPSPVLDIRPFDSLMTTLIPMLQLSGFKPAEVYQLTTRNPAKAFTIAVRQG